MLETKQKLNLEGILRIFHKFLCSLVKFIHGHKKTCVAAKIWKFAFFYCFLGFPLNFDKEKWYYMYIKRFLQNDAFLVFCHNFVTRFWTLP